MFIAWQIDSNTDGLVDFPEFVAATLHVHQLEEHNSTKWQQRSQAAFEKFDVDKDGFITPEELKMVSIIVCDIFTVFFQEQQFIAFWMSVITINHVVDQPYKSIKQLTTPKCQASCSL